MTSILPVLCLVALGGSKRHITICYDYADVHAPAGVE